MIRRAKNTTGEAIAACLKHGGDEEHYPQPSPRQLGRLNWLEHAANITEVLAAKRHQQE